METVSSPSQRKTRISDEKRISHLRRFQLLRHQEIGRLCNVMETVVPIHGRGNFPTLDIKPSRLVQLVRDRLLSIGIKVRDIRLNGSAATHVLSDDASHTYKDLDLIFVIDFPPNPPPEVVVSHIDKPSYCENDLSLDSKKTDETDFKERPSMMLRPTNLPSDSILSPHPSDKDSMDDCSSVDESGYTSGGSSVSSIPPSSCSFTALPSAKYRKHLFRSRTRSLESMSSTSSVTSLAFKSHPEDTTFAPPRLVFDSHHHNWQGIKDATMDVLLDFLPPLVNRTNMNSLVLGNAYVQKMVKVSTDTDKWSLISLNNNFGRNLELKFVQNMKRQYEFSVDSFQIILDTFLAYQQALSDCNSDIETSERFFPTVLAESVYGDFAAALRHLRLRRICTHRPEEIRGGGLLRYCNLLVRDFTPGDDDTEKEESANSSAISRLEQHMCSRFFIDFGDIERQQKKLLSYLDSHFHGEEELKFQYLLVLHKVVDTSTICLMHHERTLILHLITVLARQSLASNLGIDLPGNIDLPGSVQYPGFFLTNGHLVETAKSISHQDGNSTPSHLFSSSLPFFNNVSPSSPAVSRSSTPSTVSNSNYRNETNAEEASKAYVPQSFCCPSCCQYFHSSYYYTAPHYLPNLKFEKYPILMQPIYYDPSRMTCVYQPAGYGGNMVKT